MWSRDQRRTTAVDPTSGAVLWKNSGSCCIFGGPTVGPNDPVYDIRGWKGRALEAFSGSSGARQWTSSGAGTIQDFLIRQADAVTTSSKYYDPDNVGVLLETISSPTAFPRQSLRIGDAGSAVLRILGHHGDTLYLIRENLLHALEL